MALDWSILRSNGPVDIAGNFARGYDLSSAIMDKIHERNALKSLAVNPDDRSALASLYSVKPETALRMEELNIKRHDAARADSTRSALADFMLSQPGMQPNGLTGQGAPSAPTPAAPPPPAVPAPQAAGTAPASPAPMTATLMGGAPVSAAAATDPNASVAPAASPGPGAIPQTSSVPMSDSWREYVHNDPKGAMAFLLNRTKLSGEQAKALAGQYDNMARLAQSATDEPSYQAALQQARDQGFDVSHLPPHYSPAHVQAIQNQAMSAHEYLTVNYNLANQQADNARADRNEQSLEGFRNSEAANGRARVAATIRGQDTRRPRAAPQPKPPTPTTVIGGIMDKQARGEQLTQPEQQTLTEYRASQHPGKGSRAVSAGNGAIATNPKTGEKVQLVNGQWVPMK